MLSNHLSAVYNTLGHTLELFTCNCEDVKNYNLFQAPFAKFHFIKTPFFIKITLIYILENLYFTPWITLILMHIYLIECLYIHTYVDCVPVVCIIYSVK